MSHVNRFYNGAIASNSLLFVINDHSIYPMNFETCYFSVLLVAEKHVSLQFIPMTHFFIQALKFHKEISHMCIIDN